MMKQYNTDLKQQILKEVKETGSVISVARKHEIPSSTIHTWKIKEESGGNNKKVNDNKQFQKKLADLQLENEILKELLKKTQQIWLKN